MAPAISEGDQPCTPWSSRWPTSAAGARRGRGKSAAWAVERAAAQFAEVGTRIERMLTHNGASHRSHVDRDTLAGLEIRHKRTRPFRPQTNGKAERVIQTLINESAYDAPTDL